MFRKRISPSDLLDPLWLMVAGGRQHCPSATVGRRRISAHISCRSRSGRNHPVFRLVPIFGCVGQILVIDDDEQVIVREIAAHRIDDMLAARVGTEEDDLENAAVATMVGGASARRLRELLEQNLDVRCII